MQSSNNSHFVWDDMRVMKVGADHRMIPDEIAVDDVVPMAGNARLRLPVGSLSAPREDRAYILHENIGGEVETIALPGNLQGIKRDTLVLVGFNAIVKGLGVLPSQIERILGEEKGRVSEAMATTVLQKYSKPQK
jgi:hypothetical protein